MSSTLLALLALLIGVAGILVMRRSRRLAFVLWTVTICFVPYWLGATAVVYWSPGTIVGALIVVALLPGTEGWGLIDMFMGLLVGVLLFGVVAGFATIASGYTLVSQWALGYLIGRLVVSRVKLSFIYSTLAIAMTVVSVLAIIEFLTQFNFFVLLHSSNSLYGSWSVIQTRGGVARSEGAFGHSIALGVSIAMVIPLVIVARFPFAVRAGMLVVMTLAVVTTFSRISMICAGLGFLASLVFLREGISRRDRGILFAVTVLVGLAASPLVASTYADAGAEATDSADYRGNLLSLLPQLSSVGLSPVAYRSPSGDVYYGSFHSIDSAFIYFGLNAGYIPMAMVILILAIGAFLVVSGRGTPPLIAVSAQIPALATVALITQVGIFFWFMAGLAVTTLHMSLREATLTETAPFGVLASPAGAADRLTASPRPLGGPVARRPARLAPYTKEPT